MLDHLITLTKEILSDPGNEYSEEVVKCKDIIKIKQLVPYVSLKKKKLFFVVGVKRKYESVRRIFKDRDGVKTQEYGKKARYDRRKQRVCIIHYDIV